MIRTLIIAEDRLWIDAVSVTLEQQEGFSIVGKVTDPAHAVQAAGGSDVVVVHHGVSSPGALQLVREISCEFPAVKSVVVGVPGSAPMLVEYFEGGALGYVRVDDPLDRLVQVIQDASRGETSVDPDIAAALVDRLSSLRTMVDEVTPNVPDNVNLTPREECVLELIAEGKTNQEIADELYIEVGTVKNHVHSILQKLNVRDRQQATYYLTMREKKEPDEVETTGTAC